MTTPRLGVALAVCTTLLLAACAERGTPEDLAADPAAASASSNRTSTPAAPVVPADVASIPQDFPLAVGMASEEDLAGLVSRQGPGLQVLDLCGARPLAGLDVLDRLVADNSGGEAVDTRDLMVLSSAAETVRLVDTVVAAAAGCPSHQNEGGSVTTTEVLSSPLAVAPAAVVVQTFGIGDDELAGVMVHHVVASGNAVLVTRTYGEWTDVEGFVAHTADRLTTTVEALRLLAEDEPVPSATGEAPVSTPSEAVPPLPDHLDLMDGLPEDGGDYDVVAQSPDGAGIPPVVVCDEQVWPTWRIQDVDRLVTRVDGPEHFEGRELVALADAGAADGVLSTLRATVGSCRQEGNRVWTPVEQDTGQESVTIGLTYTDGLGSSVFQVTRVEHVLLLVTTSGEGTIDSLPQQGADVTRTTRGIARQLCGFGVAAC